MSEDDRALKAARAKAMLKKRQQKKAAGASPSDLTSPPPSRPFTPGAHDSPIEDEKPQRDLADLFSAHNPNDASWLSGLQRATSPSMPVATSTPPPLPKPTPPSLKAARASVSGAPHVSSISNGQDQVHIQALQTDNETLTSQMRDAEERLRQIEVQLQEEQRRAQALEVALKDIQVDKQTILQNQQQTVSLLVSEKASLASELERLQDLEAEATSLRQQLEAERQQTRTLQDSLQQAQSDVKALSLENDLLHGRERELAEKGREQDRMLQVSNATCTSLQKEVERAKQRFRELEDQIQADDRIEKLESTLKNTQERTADLELQLSKQKQVYSSLKEERDSLSDELEQQRESEATWRKKQSALEEECNSVKESLTSSESEKEALQRDKDSMQSNVNTLQTDITLLQEKLTQAALELASHTRQLQALQSELRSAKRRAEEAERIQTELQSEGTGLLRSLEEMRPKIVELTEVKLELSEKVSALESALRSRDIAITKLEAAVDEYRDLKEEAERKLAEDAARYQREWQSEKDIAANNLKAQTDLLEELESALASVRALEEERAAHHQDAIRQMREIDRLSQSEASQTALVATLRQEADERQSRRMSEEEYLIQVQGEVEGLRQAIESRDEEIERLRMLSASGDAAPSLDDEMLSSLEQQHLLELSSAQSRIRSLESAVFEAEARAHEMQKQVRMLEEQRPKAFSPPPIPSRPSSRGTTHSSFTAPIPRPRMIDHGLSPEARHKRNVSLSMLRARIEREGEAAAATNGRLSPVHSESSHGRHTPPIPQQHHHPRPQFLDDSHVFWCASCRGDLVVL